MSQRSTRRRLRVEQKALRHSVRGAVHLSMRRVLGMHRSSTTSALEPSASVISLCQSSSFGHAQSCTGCLASPQFVRSRNRSGEPCHDHPHELASRIQRRRLASPMPTRVREQLMQMRRLTVCRCTGPFLAPLPCSARYRLTSVAAASSAVVWHGLRWQTRESISHRVHARVSCSRNSPRCAAPSERISRSSH